MFEPVRGGTRGGHAEFKWADVSADKDRENYLGHSINAPTGRWQKNKDVHWYNRDKDQGEEERRVEIQKVKQLEAEALAAVLGYEPAKPGEANDVASGPGSSSSGPPAPPQGNGEDAAEREIRKAEKEAKKRSKALKKEEKERRRARKRHGRHEHESDDERDERRRLSRSMSPRRHIGLPRRRSRSPIRHYHGRERPSRDYPPRPRSRSRDRYQSCR